MSTATVPASGVSAWDRIRTYSPPSRYLPVLATLALFLGMFGLGGIRYEGFADPQVFLSLLLDNAFLIVLAEPEHAEEQRQRGQHGEVPRRRGVGADAVPGRDAGGGDGCGAHAG